MCVVVPEDPVLGDESVREGALQRGFVHGCGALDAGIALTVAQFGDDDPCLAIERAVRRERGAAAIGELVTVRIGWVLVCDAVGKGMDQQLAETVRGRIAGRVRAARQAPPPLPGGLVDARQRRARGIRRRAAIAEGGQCLPARGDIVAARSFERIPGFEQGGQITGQRAVLAGLGGQQHRGQTRMCSQREQALPKRREAAGFECSEAAEQITSGGQGARWWRIGETQFVAAPRGQFQCQPAQFGQRDFRPAGGFQPL